MKNSISLFLFLITCFSLQATAQKRIALRSPDRQLRSLIQQTPEATLEYRLLRGKEEIINPSALGIVVNGHTLGTGVKDLKLVKKSSGLDAYGLRGKNARARDPYNEYEMEIRGDGPTVTLVARLYNDGFAFRYRMAGGEAKTITAEHSSFTLPPGTRVWFFERNSDWKLKTYAGEWISADIDQMPAVSSRGPVQGKPLTAQLKNGGYLTLTEAALYGYSGLRYKATGKRCFQVNFTEEPKGFQVQGPLETSWRVVLYAPDLNRLVNSSLISSLNPAPDQALFADQSYIKPGRSVWSFLTHVKDPAYMQPAKEKEFINNAAKLNYEYTLIDEGWEKVWPDKWQQLKEMTAYGKSKNIGVWVWKHSNELLKQEDQLRFLDEVKKAGAVGVKVDFMNSEAKELIDFEINLLKACAQRQLMVNFHGSHPPTGESRTYPNEMTREGVRGMELNIMAEGPIPAWHNAALPFTRFVAGHGDYTPGFFSKPGPTTWGHQLATMYLFESPFLCLAEDPAYILGEAALLPVVPYLKEMPVTWDETLVLPGNEIGKLAAFARRKGGVWYVTIINGEDRKKEFALQTSFLTKGKTFKAELVNDRQSQTREFEVTELKNLTHKYLTQLPLQPNGGLVMKITL